MEAQYPEYLFDDNPPVKADFIRRLFCYRERELQFGLRLLRSGPSFSKICAVHGMTRCGKSHLVLRLLLDVEADGLPYRVVAVNANNRGTARSVLEEVFFKLWHDLSTFPPDRVPEGEGLAFEGGVAFLGAMEPLVAGDKTETSFTQSRKTLESAGASLSVVPPPFKIDFSGKLQLESEAVERWSSGVPSDRNLMELLRFEAELWALLHPGKRVLLFVDDLDLLDKPDTSGQAEANLLVDLLKTLAECPSLTVLTTLRHAYFNGREKDFKDFIEVRLVGEEDLTAIYRKHIEVFNAGEEVFTPEAIRWLVRGSAGRVGLFLHRCYQLWRYFSPLEECPLGIEHIKQYVRDDIRQLRQDPAHGEIMAAIESALRQGQVELSFPGDLTQTGVLFHILIPLPGRTRAYSINAIYAEVIRELQGENS